MACVTTLQTRYAHLAKNHPCLGRAPNKGRLHLPVSPYCNIKCRFCTRRFNKTENRPGVAQQILPVEQAAAVVGRALALCPELSVVGVAGPGDSLASDHALRVFSTLRARFPMLLGCLSTNGLMLPDLADDIVRAGVRSVTVTVNGVDPAVTARVVEKIVWQGRTLRGEEAARILIERQCLGIQRLAARGVLVKINTVLIPSLNGDHIGRIAQVCAELGASIFNIIPLIPQGDLAHLAPPDCDELSEARAAAEAFLPVFRHCQHCRADACGVLGKTDVSDRLYEDLHCDNTFSHG
ncbi:MAG: radical SAM protein [Oscillospiraceae bacterium]|jgi:nitrogen fixation protein NifB|nr:radical SAM protein [Oscillospiraceae bacterium]